MEKVHQYLKNHGKLRKFAHLCNLRIAKLYRFSTLSACCNGEQVVPLYCGFRTFENLTPSLLLQSARSAGNYLTRSVDEKGKFTYLYRPETDSIIPGYNILRHAGATYSMLELYEVTRDKALLAAACRALEYLVSSMRPCRLAGEDVLCVVEDGWVKLGGNALACIAIAKYIEISGDRRYFPELISLGRWIQLVQEESGRFFIHKQAFPNGELADFISRYYPGEALLAMARIYLLDPRETWLHTAKKGACYLIETRDAGLGLSQIGHDHWLIYALCDLYRICLDPKFLQHALHIARAITIKQRQKPHRFDWAGSFGSPPGSCPTATRMEGLCAAYRLARDFKKHEQAREILQAAKLGIGFQLHTQFTRESTIYLPNPLCCIGGFSSPKCFDIRIDCVQHNISSILAMYHILRCMEK